MVRRTDRARPAQLPLDLPHRAAMGREDFLVAGSNIAAVAMIDAWPDWPTPATILVGPEGSGKSHLGEVWRGRTGAGTISIDDLTIDTVPDHCATGALLVEDAPGAGLDEKALFHLINYMRESRGHVLITARTFPAHWEVGLKDLASRLRAAQVVSLEPPDDQLLRAVLVKLFADRQLNVDESVINFMLLRMERSLGVARTLVELIDRRALAEKSAVTRPLVARLMSGETGDLFADD
jgi:chromosomal replication initiation ATPase DnaA